MQIGDKYVKLDSGPVAEVMFHIEGLPNAKIERAYVDSNGTLFIYIKPGAPGFMAELPEEAGGLKH